MSSQTDKSYDDKILKMGGAPVGRMEFLDLEEYTIISFFEALV